MVKRSNVYRGVGQITPFVTGKKGKYMSTVQPRVPADNFIKMHKVLANEWAADMAFTESECADLLRHIPKHQDAYGLLGLPLRASRNMFAQLIASAGPLIRDCLPRPAALRIRTSPEKLNVVNGRKPIASTNIGLEAVPRPQASLLTMAARRAASLLRTFDRLRAEDGKAARAGRPGGRVAMRTSTLLRTHQHGGDAGCA